MDNVSPDDMNAYKQANFLNRRAEKILKHAESMHNARDLAKEVDKRLKDALKLVDRAITFLKERPHIEPARSQLFLNAAKISWGIGDMDRAADYIRDGLGGDAPPDNINSLLALREQVNNIRKATGGLQLGVNVHLTTEGSEN